MDTEWGGKERAALNVLRANLDAPTAIHPVHFIVEVNGQTCLLAPNGRNVARFTYREEAEVVLALVNAAPHVEAALGEMEQALLAILNQFTPEHLDAVSATSCGTNARAVLTKYALPAEREESAT